MSTVKKIATSKTGSKSCLLVAIRDSLRLDGFYCSVLVSVPHKTVYARHQKSIHFIKLQLTDETTLVITNNSCGRPGQPQTVIDLLHDDFYETVADMIGGCRCGH